MQWIETIGMEPCPTFTTSKGVKYKGTLHPVAIRDEVDEGVITNIDMNLPIPDIIKRLQTIENKSFIRRSFDSRSYIYSFYHGHYENERPLDYNYCDTCNVRNDCPNYKNQTKE